MTDDKFEHIFDQKTMVYGDETGNWFGVCKDCGIRLAVYGWAKPMGAKREEKIHSNAAEGWGEVEILWNDFGEFVAGRPNRLVRYPACGRAPL